MEPADLISRVIAWPFPAACLSKVAENAEQLILTARYFWGAGGWIAYFGKSPKELETKSKFSPSSVNDRNQNLIQP